MTEILDRHDRDPARLVPILQEVQERQVKDLMVVVQRMVQILVMCHMVLSAVVVEVVQVDQSQLQLREVLDKVA